MNFNMKDGGPAFPIVENSEFGVSELGMSFREYAAVKIFAAYITNESLMEAALDDAESRGLSRNVVLETGAKFSVAGADALIKQLQKPQ